MWQSVVSFVLNGTLNSHSNVPPEYGKCFNWWLKFCLWTLIELLFFAPWRRLIFQFCTTTTVTPFVNTIYIMTPLTASILVTAHMTCKISQQSRGEYSVITLDARLNYLDKRGFLQPLWTGTMQCRVWCAVDLRQHCGLNGLEIGTTLGWGVAQWRRS